jgi:hypothetical protein
MPDSGPVIQEVGMANSLVQAAVHVQGTIEKSNKGGLLVNGTWYNYPRGTPSEGKLSGQGVGSLVTLAVFIPEDGSKPVIGRVVKLERPEGPKSEAPAAVPAPTPVVPPAEPKPAPAVAPAADRQAPRPLPSWTADPMSDVQKERIEKLSESLNLSSQVVNLILKMRFKDEAKSVGSLTKGEASKLIQFLDSQAPVLPSRGRSA